MARTHRRGRAVLLANYRDGVRVQQTLDELEQHLVEQLRFLRRSAAHFDAGDESEAKRLATHIRILAHDTRASRSLLGQLGLKHQLGFVDTTIRHEVLPPGYTSLPPGTIVIHSGIVLTQMGAGGVTFKAPLAELAPERIGPPVSFEEWWEPEILTDTLGNEFSRRKLVLALANQDGGAHVDPRLAADYAALSRQNSLGREGTDEHGVLRPLDNIAVASVRQVAFELDRTLAIGVPTLSRLSEV